ncbi:hypothetical protein ILP97_46370 [Amycolatopsis sp. H6(2020)]|nr:hypothetical protein [Amycolatopsis sp. H6(2020)]
MKAGTKMKVTMGMTTAILATTMITASAANATDLFRSLSATSGVSIFDWTCDPPPGDTVWVEIEGNFTGSDNYVDVVRYKNFSSSDLLIHWVNVAGNRENIYLSAQELAPFSEVTYPVHRSFAGTMTIVADAVQNVGLCGGHGNRHVFTRS